MRQLFTVLLLSAPGLLACGDESRGDAGFDAASTFLPNLDAGLGKQDAASRSSGTTPSLPASLKGYELYAWEEDGALRFMLITGTNRAKTLDELRVEDSTVERDDGWVAISGAGLGRLQDVLARVPTSTDVLLVTLDELPALSPEQRTRIDAMLAKRRA